MQTPEGIGVGDGGYGTKGRWEYGRKEEQVERTRWKNERNLVENQKDTMVKTKNDIG